MTKHLATTSINVDGMAAFDLSRWERLDRADTRVRRNRPAKALRYSELESRADGRARDSERRAARAGKHAMA